MSSTANAPEQPMLKPIVDSFVAGLRDGKKKELVQSLVENPVILNALSAAEESGKAFLTNLPEDKRKFALSVLDTAKTASALSQRVGASTAGARTSISAKGGETAALLTSAGAAASQKAKEKSKEVDAFTGFLKEAGHATFYKYTDLGRSIRRGFRFTQAIIVILWIITLVLIGLTVWRATLAPPESYNGLSVGIYVATAYTFVIACAALAIYEAGRMRVKKEVDKALDRVQSVLQTFGATQALKHLENLR